MHKKNQSETSTSVFISKLLEILEVFMDRYRMKNPGTSSNGLRVRMGLKSSTSTNWLTRFCLNISSIAIFLLSWGSWTSTGSWRWRVARGTCSKTPTSSVGAGHAWKKFSVKTMIRSKKTTKLSMSPKVRGKSPELKKDKSF